MSDIPVQPRSSDAANVELRVGYKRPPRQHQFKKGHRPKPRKPKPVTMPETPGECLMRILDEERRTVIGRKVRWISNAQLVIERAFQLANKGSATLRSLLLALVFADEPTTADAGERPVTIVFERPEEAAPA
jgi:hypothetical protein